MNRRNLLVFVALALAACGPAAPAAQALGETVEVQNAQVEGSGYGPTTTLAVTATAVRTGTTAELEAAGFELEPDQASLVPYYVDSRFENRGTETTTRRLRVAMEDQDGDLISAVTIFDYGDSEFELCPDRTGDEALAPGESFESCTLFLVDPGRPPSRVSFLPTAPGVDTDWVYWAVPGS